MSSEEHDERTLEIFKKFFFFLTTPHWVDKKFIDDLLNALDKYFNDDDFYNSTKEEKDKKIANLNINELIQLMQNEIDNTQEATAELISYEKILEDYVEKCNSSYDSLTNNLKEILDAQNAYKWYSD